MTKKSEENQKEIVDIKIRIGGKEFSEEEAKVIFIALKKIFEPTVVVQKEYIPYWPWTYPYQWTASSDEILCNDAVGVDVVYSDGSSVSYTLN